MARTKYVTWGPFDDDQEIEEQIPEGYRVDYERTETTDTGYIAPLIPVTCRVCNDTGVITNTHDFGLPSEVPCNCQGDRK